MLGKSCLQFANMGAAMLQDPIFNFQTFYYHWCYARRSSLQFSNIMDATLQDLLLNIQHYWLYALRSSL